MSTSEHIRIAFGRVASALAKRPALGRSTGISTARVSEGLRCEIQEGSWRLAADMPENAGGQASGPTPGVYGRAALGSCLAIGCMMYAAKHGVPVRAFEVQVQADFDDGVLFGVADGVPGYSEVRLVVTADSDAPEADLRQVVDDACAHSPYLDVFSRAQPCHHELRIQPAGAP